jgi:hypothetical protein
VSNLLGEGAQQDKILETVVKSRAAEIAQKKESLDDEKVRLLIESLDEMNPRSAFKELKAHINRLLSRGKKR